MNRIIFTIAANNNSCYIASFATFYHFHRKLRSVVYVNNWLHCCERAGFQINNEKKNVRNSDFVKRNRHKMYSNFEWQQKKN